MKAKGLSRAGLTFMVLSIQDTAAKEIIMVEFDRLVRKLKKLAKRR